ncbi:LytTR family DNA-binding domain-containing protein [Eubacterium sp.]|uniref:LytR/AlgR family response regulator transcription factor n=1 Tax=Eubacterium sp. TaxID=142586 RepID=UPI002582AF76|nr:LytTR family DNA-binding domain-containing protein [Eubacterium sp.]MCR5367950.1 LytTR family DNA-binding domain-containing protein [Eubacterium sp.]
MRIAVCDDEERYRLDVKKRIESNFNSLDILVDCFSDGRELVKAFMRKPYEVVFLDIEMPEMDGITLAKKIRFLSESVYIIFLTGHVEYALEGYEVNALRYLTKPVDENKLIEVFRFISDKTKKNYQLRIKEDGDDILINIDDIIYMEAQNQYISIHTINGDHLVRFNISEYEKELTPYGFFRCHRSYLISLGKVKRVGKTDAVMKDGNTIPISRKNIVNLKNALYTYIEDTSI